MSFDQNGFQLIRGFLSHEQVLSLNQAIDDFPLAALKGGIRHAEQKIPLIKTLIESEQIRNFATSYLAKQLELVRVIVFDKTAGNNWLVSWHQDRTIIVKEKFHATGWGPWSIKDGVHHVQPPIEVLNNMLTLRIHLDASHAQNGGLKVLSNSHTKGILSQLEIKQQVEEGELISCDAQAGDLLLMRPLLLHASSKAIEPSRRRILHIEYK